MCIVEIKNVSKYYGSKDNLVKAVDDVSFQIYQGEFVVILGTSGSGKSTLLHMLAGVDVPSEGEIFIIGENITKMKKNKLAVFRRKNIALIYQFYNLIPILNIEENMTLPLKLNHEKPDKEEVNRIVKLLRLEDRRMHLPSQLSGGQQQRVAIARALMMKPKVLLADEPTGSLDSKNRKDIIAYFQKINKENGQTIVMVTHDDEIAKVADRILYMKDGKLVEEGATSV